ncbi:hypothetical protein QQ054_09425 [Oscillatoria amoena NRMC-F 0135]|nr:hypothetical protein [Oscillatoria amoena NRMC-F 0135]
MDLADARCFYDLSGKTVGEYFFDTLFSEIDSLSLYGGIHARRYGFHTMLSKRFPYAVYYLLQNDEVIVFRVLDCRQDPQVIEGKLSHP